MTQTEDLGFRHVFVKGAPDAGRTLLLLPGTGGMEDDLLDIGRELAPGAHLLGVRGNVLENGMPRFFRRLAEGVFDFDDLRLRTRELADFIERAKAVYDPVGKVWTAVGYSNGANIAASLLLSGSGNVQEAVLWRPMLALAPATLPDLHGVRVWLGAGRRDTTVPDEQVERLAELLTNAGAHATLQWQQAGHGLVPPDLAMAREWLAQGAVT